MSELTLLLNAKLLAPAVGERYLGRERLDQRLTQGLDQRATVIVGGPGYGKTSLVSRFLSQNRHTAAWYRLDPSDNDPWVFFQYLTAGIERHVPDFGERSASLRDSLRTPDSAERITDIFLRDAEEMLSDRMVLVLDGAEHLQPGTPVTSALRRLLEYLPGTLHVILIGRSMPELGLKSQSSRGRVTWIQPEELRFTVDETAALLRQAVDTTIGDDEIARLQRRTGGWITALQLLQTTGLRRGDTADLRLDGDETEIFDYFSEEVLAAEPPEIQRFLLGASLPTVIDAEVVGAALNFDDVHRVLDTLLRRHLFLSPLEGRPDLYTFDPLFRDFLAKKLRLEHGMREVRDLHAAFGRCLAERNAIGEAIEHLIQADAPQQVTELLAVHGRSLLVAGHIESIRRAAEFAARAGTGCVLADVLGESYRLTGDYAAARGHFESALADSAEALRGPARARALQGLAYSLLKLGHRDQAEAAARLGLEQANDAPPGTLARILNTLAIIRYQRDDMQAAIATWNDALSRARQAADEHLVLFIAHNLGLPYALTGDLTRARECFELVTGRENRRQGPEEGAAYLNLARIAIYRGELERAARLLGDAHEIAQRWKLQALEADILEAQGNLLRENGELDDAARRYASARALLTSLGLHSVLDSVEEEEAVLAGHQGALDRSERLTDGLIRRARDDGDDDRLASALLAQGEVRARFGDATAAVAPLTESAATFSRLDRQYLEFLACLWLALAHCRLDQRELAEVPARRALELATRHDYRHALHRAARADAGLRALLEALPGGQPLPVEDAATTQAPSAPVALDRPDLSVNLLGPTQIFRDEASPIPQAAWKLKRPQKMFCFLVSARKQRVTKDRLADAIWRDARPSVIDKNFHPTVSALRRALNYGHQVTKNFILYERGTYVLNPAYSYRLDFESFETGIVNARRLAASGDPAAALREYDAALALYRGPFLDDAADLWAEAPRAHFAQLYTAALIEASSLHLDQGDADTGLELLGRRMGENPLDESASIEYMKALSQHGRRSAVDDEFKRLKQALRRELRVAPSVEARQAYRVALALSDE